MNEGGILQERIISKISVVRGKKVMLDSDLANLYEVPTKVLNQSVKRNIRRFPKDFMFRITKNEYAILRSQFVTLKQGRHRKYLPYVFTEQGVAMLSSVLNSERAIEVNIAIMKTFVKLREMLSTHEELKEKIEQMESRYDYQFKVVFDAIKQLLEPEEKPKRRIGFHHQD